MKPKYLFVICTILAISVHPVFATNVSILYGWNGTNFVPLKALPDGTLETTLNLSESIGINPRLNNTYDLGSALLLWANAYARTIRSTGPLSLIAGGTEAITVTAGTGLVGINTTSPTSLLHVAGNANITGTLYGTFVGDGAGLTGADTNVSILYGVNQSNTTQITYARLSPTGSLMFSVEEGTGAGWNKVGSNVYLSSAADSVGIGTASPSQKLEIASGNLNISGGNAFITGALVVNGTAISTSASNDNTTLTAMLGQKLNLTGGTLSGLLSITGNPSNAGNLSLSVNSTLYVNQSTSNVGIGTTGPSYLLDVNSGRGTAIRIGDTGEKGFLGNYAAFYMLYNAEVNSAGNWVARGTSMSALSLEAGQVDFYTNTGLTSGNTFTPSTKFTILSSGNVGIGTTNPISVAGWSPLLAISGSYGGILLNSTSTNGRAWSIGSNVVGTNGILTFYEDSSAITRMAIQNGTGNVGIGTTGPGEKLHVVGDLKVVSDSDVSGTLGSGIIYTQNTGGTEGVHIDTNEIQTVGGDLYLQNEGAQDLNVGNGDLFVETTGGNVGIGTTTPGEKLTVNGNVSATAYYYASDIRLKENVKTISGLEMIEKLRGVSFNWKSGGQKSMGLIAQEVEAVAPEIVVTDSYTGMKSVNYGVLAGPMIEAIKELHKESVRKDDRIAELERAVTALRSELDRMERRMP